MKDSVETYMRTPPVMVLSSDNVLKVAEKMYADNIGAVIVMRRGSPAGIITERDIVKKIVIDRKNPAKTTAQEVMSTPLVWIESNETVADALELMRENNVRRLAVIRNGRLVGMVTERRLTLSYEKR
ncbi:MAG: CBS domain-containing protein [Candidatus Bathyarchaeota archaeon]|nr:CBS domain-containing protein [Candidatus Bathyarchaeota archaeon]